MQVFTRVHLVSLTVLLTVLLSVLAPADVYAHARLLLSDPTSGSARGDAPASFLLTFNEPVDASVSQFDLLDSVGNPVGLGTAVNDAEDRSLVTIPFPGNADVAPGTYTLVWRVLSEVDGHVTTGTVPFSVGTGEVPEVGAGSGTARPPWWSVFTRWIELVGWIGIAGLSTAGLLYSRMLRENLNARDADAVSSRWRSLWMVSAGIAVAGMLLGLWAQARWSVGPDSSVIPPLNAFRDVLANSNYGQGWIVRLVILAVLIGVLSGRWSTVGAWTWAGASLLSVTALLLISRSGHAAAEDRPELAIAVDTIHFSTVAIWIGSLTAIVAAIRILRNRSDVPAIASLSLLVQRHSRLSLIVVPVLAVAGVVNATFHVSGPRALRVEDYGLVLLSKQALFLIIIIGASINLLVLRPRIRTLLADGESEQAARRIRSIRYVGLAELIVAGVALLASAALTQLAPADGPLPLTVAARGATIDERSMAGDIEVWMLAALQGDPADRYTFTLTDSTGDAPSGVQRVIVRTELLASAAGDSGIGDRFDADLLEGEPGAYAFPANRIGLDGEWEIDLTIRREGVQDVGTVFKIDTAGTSPPPPRLVEDSWQMPRLTVTFWGYAFMAVAMLLLGVAGLRVLTGLEPIASGVLLAMSLLIAAGFVVSATQQTVPVTDMNDVQNPVEFGSISLQEGAELYLANCLICHGPEGTGSDDTDPVHQHGSAADLTDDQSSLQSDGDLFYWIEEGIGGTDMPSYEVALTEEEKWHLVNYIRQLQGERTLVEDEP